MPKQVETQDCKDVPREICNDVQVPNCVTVPKTSCTSVPMEVEEKICAPVSREDCTQVRMNEQFRLAVDFLHYTKCKGALDKNLLKCFVFKLKTEKVHFLDLRSKKILNEYKREVAHH